jgi:outer membrane receptor protein involved in Fe transport
MPARRPSLRRSGFAGSLLALAASGQCWGQDTAAADTSGSGLETITVTAQRRSESIQAVPLSVSAISGETLERFGDLNFNDYAATIPNLSFGTGNGFGVSSGRGVTIRGIAGTNTTSFYINDTPVPLSLDPRVLDLERIEVLRGPQGTLFGSSSMGGTIRVITRPASLEGFSGSADIQGFGTERAGAGYDVSGTVNIPVIDDVLAIKASAYSSFAPGFFTVKYGVPTTPGVAIPPGQAVGERDHVGNDGEYGGIVSATIHPGGLDRLTITPMVIYQDRQSNGLPLADYNTHNLIQIRPLNVPEGVVDSWTFAALTAKYETDFGQFISSSTFFNRKAYDNEDGTEAVAVLFSSPQSTVYQASPSPSYVNTKSFTQEVRFESKFDSPIQIVVGGYYNYTNSHTKQFELTPFDSSGDLAFTENIPAVSRELAGFGDVTYDITEQLQISAGVRDALLSNGRVYKASGWINGGVSDSPARHQEEAATPRFTAKYQFDDKNMIYVNAAKGFRAGGQNSQLPPLCDASLAAAGLPPGSTPYNSDSLWSYEIGAKNSWWDGRINTRAALYHIDWDKIQQSVLLSCTYHIVENAGAATSDGGEFEADISPLDGLKFTLGVGYEDAKITQSAVGSSAVVGQPLNGVPRWTASLLGEYSVPTSFGSAFVRGQYSFTGKSTSLNVDPTNGRERASYELVNVRFGVDSGPWEAALFVKNLFDVRANLSDEQSEIAELPGRPRYLINAPRTLGIDIRREF